MLDSKKLKSRMVLAGVAAKDLAEAQGWSMSAAYRKINGHVPFNLDEVDTCKQLLHLTNDQVLEIFFAGSFS